MSKKLQELQAKRLNLLNQAEAITSAATDETPITDDQVRLTGAALKLWRSILLQDRTQTTSNT